MLGGLRILGFRTMLTLFVIVMSAGIQPLYAQDAGGGTPAARPPELADPGLVPTDPAVDPAPVPTEISVGPTVAPTDPPVAPMPIATETPVEPTAVPTDHPIVAAEVTIKGVTEDGGSAEGAYVLITDVAGIDVASGELGATNQFTAELANGDYIVRVEATTQGYDVATSTFTVGDGPATAEVPLTAHQETVIVTVTGTVTDGQTGDPITGAAVTVDGTQLMAITGTDGTYAIADVPAGDHTFLFNANGYENQPISAVVDPQRAQVNAALTPTATSAARMAPAAATHPVTINAVTSNGGSAEGARLFIADVNADYADVASGSLDANNQFSTDVPNGEYLVHVYAVDQGYYISEAWFTVADAPTTVDLQLSPGKGRYAVTGTVIDVETGEPIAGATVMIDGTQLTGTTRADGTYTINQVLAGNQTFVFSATGYESMSVTRNVYSRSENVPNVALTPVGATTYAVTVGVVTVDGSSFKDAFVEILDVNRVVVAAGTLDANNQFAAGEVPNGDYMASIDDGWGGRNTVPFTVADAPATVDVALERGQFHYVVIGTLTDVETGKPIAGATVAIDGTQLAATTGADGTYTITQVPEGRRTFVFDAAGYESVRVTRNVYYQFQPVDALLTPIEATTYTVTINGVTSDGGSAEGALVEIFDVNLAVVAAGTLDADNSFTAEVVNGDYFALIEGKRQGYSYHDVGFRVAGAPHTVDISLSPGSKSYVVTGTVTDADSGAPIAGATVSVRSVPDAVERTDVNGTYVIEDLWGGERTFDFSAPGYDKLSVVATIGDGSTVVDAALTARDRAEPEPEPVTVTGTVTDGESGDPVAGATVSIDGLGTTATTGPDGTYAIADVPQDYHIFTFSADGYLDVSVGEFVAEWNTVVEVGLTAIAPGTYPVTINAVTSDGGSAEFGAQVSIFDANDDVVAAGQLNARNQFAAALLPGDYTVTVVHEIYEPNRIAFTVAGTAQTVNLPLQYPHYTVTGKVTDIGTGAPIAGAMVSLDDSSFTATTAADGTYAIAAVPAGSYKFVFTSPGYDDLMLERGFYAPRLAVIDAALTPTGSEPFAVTIVGDTEDDGSAQGAYVRVSDANGVDVATGELDANNQFVVDELVSGNYTVTIYASGFSTPYLDNTVAFTMHGSDQTVEVPLLLPPYTVTGTVTDAGTGDPISGATVRAVSGWDGREFTTTTGADGTYALNGPGEYHRYFHFSADGYNDVSMLTYIAPNNTVVDAVLTKSGAPAFPVTIAANTWDGNSAEGAFVMIYDANDNRVAEGYLDADNQFAAGELTNGHYTVYALPAEGSGYAANNSDTFTVAGEPKSVEVLIGAQASTYGRYGYVWDVLTGDPIGGVTVTVQGTQVTTTTGPDGMYSILDVPEGTHTLVFRAEGYYSHAVPGYFGRCGSKGCGPMRAGLLPMSGTAAVTFIGVTSDGGSAEGAAVTITDAGGTDVATGALNATNQFTADLETGKYTVTVDGTVQGYDVGTATFTIAGSRLTVDVPLRTQSATVTVTGTVTDDDTETAAPIAGAAVTVDGTGLSATTGADGSYTIAEVPAGNYTFVFSAEGYVTAEVQAAINADNNVVSAVLTPTDAQTFPVTITYDAPDGGNAEGALVFIERNTLRTLNAPMPDGMLDANNSFTTNLRAGDYTVTIDATAQGYGVTRMTFTVTNGPLAVEVVPAAQQVTVTGTVTDARTGALIGGATIVISGAGLTATTGSDGAYAISDVPVGTYTVVFRADGYDDVSVLATIRTGDTVVSAALTATGIETFPVTITVGTSDDGSADGAVVTITNAAGAVVGAGALEANHSVTIDLVAGEYSVTVDGTAQGYDVGAATFTVPVDGDVGVELIAQVLPEDPGDGGEVPGTDPAPADPEAGEDGIGNGTDDGTEGNAEGTTGEDGVQVSGLPKTGRGPTATSGTPMLALVLASSVTMVGALVIRQKRA